LRRSCCFARLHLDLRTNRHHSPSSLAEAQRADPKT
jgi:hypothetical protein